MNRSRQTETDMSNSYIRTKTEVILRKSNMKKESVERPYQIMVSNTNFINTIVLKKKIKSPNKSKRCLEGQLAMRGTVKNAVILTVTIILYIVIHIVNYYINKTVQR